MTRPCPTDQPMALLDQSRRGPRSAGHREAGLKSGLTLSATSSMKPGRGSYLTREKSSSPGSPTTDSPRHRRRAAMISTVTSVDRVNASLRKLQRLVRRRPSANDPQPVQHRAVPADLAREGLRTLGIVPDEAIAHEAAMALLRRDLRFEYMKSPSEALWRFVAEAVADENTDHVPVFIGRHAREPFELTCYLPVEFLAVEVETRIMGLTLLPLDDARLPHEAPWTSLDQATGCVAAIPVQGTSLERMAQRAATEALHGLALLRLAVATRVGPSQRRFRLGVSYAFDDRLSGWRRRPDSADTLHIPAHFVAELQAVGSAALPVIATSDIEKRAEVALKWMDQATFVGDPLLAMTLSFFALEALLGDKSAGMKSDILALRQAMLNHAVTGSFTHPSVTWFLYNDVRSVAVHGGKLPNVEPTDTSRFMSTVRTTFNEYLAVAYARSFTNRSQLLAFLDHHDDKPLLDDWLRKHGGQPWPRILEPDPREAALDCEDPGAAD